MDGFSLRWCLDEGGSAIEREAKRNVRKDIERRKNQKKDGELDVLPTS